MRTNQTHNNNNGKNSNTESKLQQKTQITQKYKSIHVLERRPMSFILDTDVPYACLFLTHVCYETIVTISHGSLDVHLCIYICNLMLLSLIMIAHM